MDQITKSLQIYLREADIDFFTIKNDISKGEVEKSVTYIYNIDLHLNKTNVFIIEINPKLQIINFTFQPCILFEKNSVPKIKELGLIWNVSHQFMTLSINTLSINNVMTGCFIELYDVQFSFKILCDCTGLTRLLWYRYLDVVCREISIAMRHLNMIRNIMSDSNYYPFSLL